MIKSKELKKSVFGHGGEVKVASSQDQVECPIQEDPTKFQRKNCYRVTDQNLAKFRNKIVNLATSTEPSMVKIEVPMPYYETKKAIGYLDMVSGDCVFFHENGKYWGYKIYNSDELQILLPECTSIKNPKSPSSEYQIKKFLGVL